MNQPSLIEGEDDSSGWVRRTALVTFCLLLIGTLGLVFTRLVAARVPEQRATLEKLITDRTGLAVRFENVRFAWGLEGTSAVFTRVELTDPKKGRVRVVAPELRVEFDAWDFLRHHQFSLGHVTLSSPDIEIIGDAEVAVPARVARAGSRKAAPAADDEAALVRRYTAWAELMPNGRIEVEGARVHLVRRGDSAQGKRSAHRSFTLSQAIISRGPSTFSAHGTMLLSQDVGQSLFVSAKLEGLDATHRVSGELRLIARRVFLDKIVDADALPGLRGRGTIDAKLALRDGRVESASWQASARELELERGTRFDHVTVTGKLARDAHAVLLDFTDLQLTRGARLERAPNFSARLALEPGTTRIARTTVRADRLPFMGAEFVAGILAPQLGAILPAGPAAGDDWTPTAGELRALAFDSGERRRHPDAWTFSATLSGAELTRATDRARLAQVAAQVTLDAGTLALSFDAASPATLRMTAAGEPRPLALAGRIAIPVAEGGWRFDDFTLRSGDAVLAATGDFSDAPRARPLDITVTNFDRALAGDAWSLLAHDAAPPAALSEITQGTVAEGTLRLAATRADGALAIAWPESRGKLALAQLASLGGDGPRLADGRGSLSFARGAAQLSLDGGRIDDLALTSARVDWPRGAPPRLRASLAGSLSSPVLRKVLAAQGLERLSGNVSFDAEARGEREMRTPDAWRVTARLSEAVLPLGGKLPPVENLSGTLRYADSQLRGLALAGAWLGGPVEIETRRASARGVLALVASGTAQSAPLLAVLGRDDIGRDELGPRVGGEVAWTANAQRLGAGDWQVELSSNLVGLESRLPQPFDKAKSRAVPLTASLRISGEGVREFDLEGPELALAGESRDGVLTARFDVQGVKGGLRRGAAAGERAQVDIERLELKRAPVVLATAGALLDGDDVAVNIGDLRYADRSLGPLHAGIARRAAELQFSLESPLAASHRLEAQGRCDEKLCTAEFTADTRQLAALLRGVELPPEWPAESLHADGEISWPAADPDLPRALAGRFDLETQGADVNHQLVANATLVDGEITLANVQGSGPGPTQVFRGSGRVGLVARDYDLTVDYEQITLAASAVPTPARAGLARAWNVLRGSAAKRGWTEAPVTKRVQWHGYWDTRR